MAEVLITIGIIGIIAAMTFPVLLGKYRKVVAENKLKVAYSLISQALYLVQAENGMSFVPDEVFGSYENSDVNGYSWELSHDVFEHYFAPHFNIIRRFDKDESSLTLCNEKGEGCILLHLGYLLTLKNGVSISYMQQMQQISSGQGTYLLWYIIINPIPKDKKIISGKDIFLFVVRRGSWNDVSSMNLTTYSDFNELSRDKIKEYCVASSGYPYSYYSREVFCTLLIFQNGMEIPDDYPVRL